MFRSQIVILGCLLLVGCSPIPYQKATEKNGVAWDGYLDEQVAPGEYLIEVSQKGGYQHIADFEGTMETYRAHWHKRANELCPAGYTGAPEKILPYEAKIERFRCELRYCQDYPMVSGYIKCNET